MSFHSDVIATLRSDVETALGLGAGAAYSGRRPQSVQRDTEVWVERLSSVDVARGTGNEQKEHRYTLHVFVKNLQGPDGAGDALLTAVEAHMRTLVARYHGARPAALLSAASSLVSCKAIEGVVDADPSEQIVEGTVDLHLYEA